jgi:hypothetical protein
VSPPAAWSATRLARRCARRQPPCMVDISPPLVSIPTGSRTFASCWSMLELVQCSYYTSLSLQYCTGFQITSRGQRAAQRAKSHSAHAPPREPRRSCRLTDRRTAQHTHDHIHNIVSYRILLRSRYPGQPRRRQNKHAVFVLQRSFSDVCTCCPTFGELAGFDIGIFGLMASLNMVDISPGPDRDPNMDTPRHSKKEKYVHMPTPPPRPRRRRWCERSAESDDDGHSIGSEARNNLFGFRRAEEGRATQLSTEEQGLSSSPALNRLRRGV